METKQLKLGTILSYISMGVSILIGLIYTPVMLNILGKSEYGLYNTVASAISMISILNLGFSSGYIKYYSKYKEENKQDEINKLNGLFLLVFIVLGIIAFMCGSFLAFHLNAVYADGLTAEEYSIAKVLTLLLSANLFVSFVTIVFSSIISAHERFVFLKAIGLLSQVVSPLVTLPILLLGFRSIGMVCVTVTIEVIVCLIEMYYVISVLKNKFVFHGFEKGLLLQLFSYTSFTAINLLVDQINWHIDKTLLGRFQGTVVVSIYSIGYYLFQCYMKFSTSIAHMFTPRVHRIVVENKYNMNSEREKLTTLFTKVGRFQFLILGLLCTGIIFFGKEFIRYIWMGEGYDDSYYVALLLIIPASIDLIQNVGIEIQRAKFLHKFRSFVYAIMAAINLILSIYLCQVYGAIGSAVGTAISLVLVNGLVMNIYYWKKCNLDIPCFWRQILRISIGLIPPIILGVAIKKALDCTNPLILVLSIVLYTMVYVASMWLLGMNTFEKQVFLKPINAFVTRIKIKK